MGLSSCFLGRTAGDIASQPFPSAWLYRGCVLCQVLSLDPATGRIALPPGFKRLWVEVGSNSRNTLAAVEARCGGNEDVFVLSFEPLLGQYCRLSASEKRCDRHGRCAGF